MATITLSLPEEFDKARRKYADINWNEVLKSGILEKLAELKKFEELKGKGKV